MHPSVRVRRFVDNLGYQPTTSVAPQPEMAPAPLKGAITAARPKNGDDTQASPPRSRRFAYLAAFVFVIVAVLAIWLLARTTQSRPLSILLTVPLLASLLLFGLRSAIFAALLAALAHDYLLATPLFELNMVSLGVTAICLTSLAIAFAMMARARARSWCRIEPDDLAQVLPTLANMHDWDERARSLAAEFKRRFGATAVIYPVRHGKPGSIAGWHAPHDLLELNALEWSAQWGVPTGRGTGTMAAADYQFHPILLAKEPIAVLGIQFDPPDMRFSPGEMQEFRVLLGLCSLALLPAERSQPA